MFGLMTLGDPLMNGGCLQDIILRERYKHIDANNNLGSLLG